MVSILGWSKVAMEGPKLTLPEQKGTESEQKGEAGEHREHRASMRALQALRRGATPPG